MEKEDQRNFLIAMVAMIAFVFAYQAFIMKPAQEEFEANQAVREQLAAADARVEGGDDHLQPPREEDRNEGHRRLDDRLRPVLDLLAEGGCEVPEDQIKTFYRKMTYSNAIIPSNFCEKF